MTTLSPQTRATLESLIPLYHAYDGPTRLDMADFFRPNADSPAATSFASSSRAECGTAACAIGLLPQLGFAPTSKMESWLEYGTRVTGVDWSESGVWNWLFAGNWKRQDNTLEGVCLRIRWLLDHGLPEDWRAQIQGSAPLCYRAGAASASAASG